MNTFDFRLIEYMAIFFLLGGVSGFTSGLFGIGGGILRIPLFALLFPAFGIHGEMEMHVAAATSLALAVPSGALALRKHRRLGNFDPAYFRTWAIGLLKSGDADPQALLNADHARYRHRVGDIDGGCDRRNGRRDLEWLGRAGATELGVRLRRCTCLVMLPGVIYATPRGVAIATRLDKQILQRIYSLFLLVIVATMIWHSVVKS